MTQKLEPKIYVACLAAYNAGHLHGRWLDAAREPDEIQDDICAILESSPVMSGGDYAIHDYEDFGPMHLEEYHDIAEVSRLAQFIEEYGEPFAAFASHVGADFATEESFQDAYHGRWDSERDYAEHVFDELYLHELPEHLRCYIDYEAFARDLFLDGHYSLHSSDFGVHVFAGI